MGSGLPYRVLESGWPLVLRLTRLSCLCVPLGHLPLCVIAGTLRTEITRFLFVTFITTLALYRRVFREQSVQDVTASHLVFNRYFIPYGLVSTVTVS